MKRVFSPQATEHSDAKVKRTKEEFVDMVTSVKNTIYNCEMDDMQYNITIVIYKIPNRVVTNMLQTHTGVNTMQFDYDTNQALSSQVIQKQVGLLEKGVYHG
jgi:Zn-dependent M32 family carboxypeptidase